MKKHLKLAVLAISIAAPVFAGSDLNGSQGVDCAPTIPPNGGPVPDAGATALLAAISFGGIYVAKKVTKK